MAMPSTPCSACIRKFTHRIRIIPTDRIVDGLDQTALFLKGDTHSRRDYVFIYAGQ